ncbi:MAG: hypothetical protein CMN85_10710 [Spongiibacteraceae bacterium]|nr:hypothetical protein [Spongiibacteraceae bacterium]|tara:strand:+ start:33548 stop:33730 length:183 start_codon:yes stop_codon:yes gene_type:complete
MDRPKPWLRTRFLVTMTALICTAIALFTNHINGGEFVAVITTVVSAFKLHDLASDKINRG